MVRKDDRTPEEHKTHTWLVIGTDKLLSGWGGAKGGASYAAWACRPEDRKKVLTWVESRSDMLRVRETTEKGWDGRTYRYYPNPRLCAHLHIYVVRENHPAVAS